MVTMLLWILASTISVSISDEPIEALKPLEGIVTIEHREDEAVDPSSFEKEDEKLDVVPLGEKKSAENVLSSFSFKISAEEEGLHELSPISVVVGGGRISSPTQSYQVKHKPPETALELRAYLYGKKPFYPGEKIEFVYKIYYRGEVSLSKEVLPLLEATDFRKIGTIEVAESEEYGYHVQTFVQRAESLKAGDYTFPESKIEGILGNGEKASSIVAPFTFTVEPFPNQEKPLSFTGSLGEVSMETSLLSPQTLKIGHIVQIEIRLLGKNLEEVDFPDILCMPGFAGNFTLGDLPTVGVTKEWGKTFLVELRPLNIEQRFIPELEFSSYLPEEHTYQTVRSAPIEITVIGENREKVTQDNLVATTDWQKAYQAGLENKRNFDLGAQADSKLVEALENYDRAFSTSDVKDQEKYLNKVLDLLPADGEQSGIAYALRAEVFKLLNRPGFSSYYEALSLGKSSWKLGWLALIVLLSVALAYYLNSKRVAWLLFTVVVVIFSFDVWLNYALPLQGFAVEAATLLTAPEGSLIREVSDGERLQVLSIDEKGMWVQVQTEKGEIGVLPLRTTRILTANYLY